jgi:YidC/Oxa1 family membrane protein insertase
VKNRNLIIAVVLAGLVVVFFGIVLPLITGKDKDDKKQEAQEELVVDEEEDDEDEEEIVAGQEPDEDDLGDLDEEEDLLEAEPEVVAPPVTLETDAFLVVISPRGGGIRSLTLKNERYVKESKSGKTRPVDIVSRGKGGKPLPLLAFQAKAKAGAIKPDLVYEVAEVTKTRAVFTAKSKSWKVKRTFKILEQAYKVESVTTIKNLSKKTRTVRPLLSVQKYMKEAKGGGFFSMFKPQLNIVKGMCMLDGDMERKDIKKMRKKGGIDRLGRVDYLAVDDLYFTTVLMPLWGKMQASGPEGEAELELRCRVGPDGADGLRGTLDFGKTEVRPGETIVVPVHAYLGPKEYETLEAAGEGLGESVDYGWFGPLARFLYVVLTTFHGWVGNWALAIIMLTILVKLVLSPLTHWSFKSMQKMQTIKPLIDDLNARYPEPEDRDKKNQAMMALYKTHKINPLMGCFPMLLQMPIWIALYRMLANSVELYRTPLILWISDMSQPDPYFVLPLVLGGSMFLQQKLTPTTADSQQAKMMMYMMPIMFTFFMLMLPAGLNLYILVNTMLTIAQQRLLYRPKVVTAEASKVQLMSEMEPGQAEEKRKAHKDRKSSGRKRGKGRKKK